MSENRGDPVSLLARDDGKAYNTAAELTEKALKFRRESEEEERKRKEKKTS